MLSGEINNVGMSDIDLRCSNRKVIGHSHTQKLNNWVGRRKQKEKSRVLLAT